MRTIISFILAGAALGLLLSACGDSGDASGAAVHVTATTPQVADFVREVGGDRVAVDQILSPSSDPHEYEPRPSDAATLADADLVVSSGGDLDSWLGQVVDASGTDATELTLIDHVETRTVDGETDPHWWLDPRNTELAVGAIADALAEADPDGAAGYRRRADAYLKELRDLDSSIAACMSAIPAPERKLVTSHDALGYYADRYGIEVIGAAIPSLSTQGQASAGETADLVDTIKRTGVSTVFPEEGTSAKLERAIADEAGAKVGGELWTDTLGPDGSDGATYVEAMRSNTAKLADGFTDGRDDCAEALGG